MNETGMNEYNPLLGVELSDVTLLPGQQPHSLKYVTPAAIRPVEATPLSPNDLSLMMSQTTEARIYLANMDGQNLKAKEDIGNFQAQVDASIRSAQVRHVLTNCNQKNVDFSVNNTPKPSNWADSPDPVPQFPPKMRYTEQTYEYTSIYDQRPQSVQPSAPPLYPDAYAANVAPPSTGYVIPEYKSIYDP